MASSFQSIYFARYCISLQESISMISMQSLSISYSLKYSKRARINSFTPAHPRRMNFYTTTCIHSRGTNAPSNDKYQLVANIFMSKPCDYR